MNFGGGLEINNNFCCFVVVLFFLVSVRLFNENRYEGLTNEEPLYYDENTFKTTSYNAKDHDRMDSNDPELTADYYKNLNPYGNNDLHDAPIPKNINAMFNPMGQYNTPHPGNMMPPKEVNFDGQYIPGGIKKKDIPEGQEDLYILKSQVVPPVCPACPVAPPSDKKCPPCAPCGRCPEPDFSCKKVPNYKVMSEDKVPDFKPQMSGNLGFR